MSGEVVLVTGGSGYVGAFCILQLLREGYRVRTTVRSLTRSGDVRAMLAAGGAAPGAPLEFAAADLVSDTGWPEAVAGCAYVLHVASPFPAVAPDHEDELIVPARDGALRVLKAARDAGVRRVVLTSSFAAVGYGRPASGHVFTEADWTDPAAAGVSAYVKSKVLAERAAWEFIAREGGALELAVVNPTAVLGPVLGPDYASSVEIVRRLISGGMPFIPRLAFGVVDVRDVADLHLRAMTDPAAKGERFLATSGLMSVADGARLLRARLGADARRVPTFLMPDWGVRALSAAIPLLRPLVADLGVERRSSSDKAQRLLGWQPRTIEETVVDTARSLGAHGQLPGAR